MPHPAFTGRALRGAVLVALFILAACDRPDASDALETEAATASAAVGVEDCAPDGAGLDLPDGFCAVLVSEGVGRARHLAVDEDGDVYVILRSATEAGGVVALRDTTGDGRADVTVFFGDLAGTGIGLRDGYLYVAPDDAVYRYRLPEEGLVPEGAPDTVVASLNERGQHAAKSFDFDGAGHLYVNVGAPSNACQDPDRVPGVPGQDPCPLLDGFGGVWRFDADATGQTQEADGHRFATGIRNAVAIAWNPLDDHLYIVQHGRDQLDQMWPERFSTEENTRLPAEEFFQVSDGDDFGWPYCYYDPELGRKVLSPEYGGDGQEVGRCAAYEDPVLAFPAHWAPNDLVFYTAEQFPARYRGGAFIAFHGSWNRSPVQEGFRVVYVPFEGGAPADAWEDFATGFAGTDSLASARAAEYRPMGLALGPDGTLYIADSMQGRIWRVVFTGASS